MTSPLEFDRKHIWHPYSSIVNPIEPLLVHKASGTNIVLEDGTELIDAMSSWWSVIHGYNHPELNAAAIAQMSKMSHVMFGGLSHQPAIDLSRKLIELTPASLQKVFLCDTGSVSVEVALKMAVQYWLGKGLPHKNKFAAFLGGYHGDTHSAMSVSDPINGMHSMFKGVLTAQIFLPRPPSGFASSPGEREIASLRDNLANIADKCAGLILEPIVQGAGGMYFYSPDYLKAIAEVCKEQNILLIADEIATGFGRTGKMFACEHADIQPDILCLGKALTGGYMSQAATLCSDEVADGVSKSEAGVFMHGPTFMGNPLACSVSIASINLLLKNNWRERIALIEAQLKTLLFSESKNKNNIADIRVLGGIGVIETKVPVDMKKITAVLLRHGVWLRPFGKLVYTMPPYICNESDIQKITDAMFEVSTIT